MQKIMMALGNEKLEEAIKLNLNNEYLFTTPATRKGMVIPLVKQENPEILIIREKLIGELNEDMYDILYQLRTDFPLMRVVYLYTLDEEEIEKVVKYVQIGIYDIWTEKQIHIQDIVNMVKKPKNFGDWARVLNREAVEKEAIVPQIVVSENMSKPQEDGYNSGHLKLKQEHQEFDTTKQRVIPNLVTNKGLNMGRIKRPQSVKDAQVIEFKKENMIDLTPSTFKKEEKSNKETSKDDILLNETSFELGTESTRKEEEKQKKESSDKWTCSCGKENEGKFCTECGKPRPSKKQNDKPMVEKETAAIKEVKQEKPEKVIEKNKEVDFPLPVGQSTSIKPTEIMMDNGKMATRTPLRAVPGLAARRASQLQQNKVKGTEKDITKRVIEVPIEIKEAMAKKEELAKIEKAKPVYEQKSTESVPKKKEKNKHNENKSEKSNNNHQLKQPVKEKTAQEIKKEKQTVKNDKKLEQKNLEKQEIKEEKMAVVNKPAVESVAEQKNKKEHKVNLENVNTVPDDEIEVFDDCKTILFANANPMSLSHTALNTAILLANKGKQVVYIDTTVSSASDCLLFKNPKVNLYGVYLIYNCNLMVEKEFLRLAFIKTVKETNVFDLIKRITSEKEAEYIIINADIHSDLEKLLILSDKNYILMEQSPVQLKMLTDNYKYRFRHMDIILENYSFDKLSIKEIVEQTKCGKVIKIKDDNTMNYKSLMVKKPLVFNQDLKNEGLDIDKIYEQLLSILES